MASALPLAERIKAEFESRAQRLKAAEQDKTKGAEDREKRLAQFGKACEDLKSVWGPRLQEFAKQFGETIKVSPTITPALREAKFHFLSDLANVTLTLTVAPSPDATKLVLDYDLLIIPVYFDYERHARLEVPLDAIDRDAVGKWIDDQFVSCVKAYLSIQDNQFYLKRVMVQDPITKAQFLPQDARAKLEHAGKTYYFSSEESLQKFREAHPDAPAKGATPAAPAPAAARKPAAPAAPAAAARPAAAAKGR